MNNIDIRRLTTMEELTYMQSVEQKVWAQPPTPTHQTFTIVQNGGVILGAYKDDEMIGFVYSFPSFQEKQTHLHSHMLGILPEHRQGGMGEKLKREQAKVAKEMGYSMMTWTFDPLESINAYLNIHKLRAVGAYYKENYYGVLKDGINQGLPTDRILIKWDLLHDRTLPSPTINEDHLLLIRQPDGSPAHTHAFLSAFTHDQDQWLVAVPDNFQSLKQEEFALAKKWRYFSRDVFSKLFSTGYKVVNFVRDSKNNQSYYVFEQ